MVSVMAGETSKLYCGLMVGWLFFGGVVGGEGAELEDFLGEARFERATWGIHVEDLESGEVVVSRGGERLMQPASSAKLMVGAMALDQWGSGRRWETALLREGEVSEGGELGGRLIIRGVGDFSWSDRFGAGRAERVLEEMVAMVRAAGIRRVRGDLVGDVRLFRGPFWGVGWGWDDLQYGYGGGVSALMWGDGRFTLRMEPGREVGSGSRLLGGSSVAGLRVLNRVGTVGAGDAWGVLTDRAPGSGDLVLAGALAFGGGVWEETFSVPDPALAFLGELRRALGGAGIVVEGDLDVWGWATHGGRLPGEGGLRELGRVESAAMSELVGVMLGVSQNQYAQMLLLVAGAELEAVGEAGGLRWTADLGLERMGRFLGRAGVAAGEYRMDEASGLARSDRVTAAALVRLLRYMDGHPEREAFMAGLPVTVIHTAESELEVRAKSGTMSDIYALAGYARPYGGRALVFSVMLNGFKPSEAGEGRRAVLESVRLAVLGAGEGRGEGGGR